MMRAPTDCASVGGSLRDLGVGCGSAQPSPFHLLPKEPNLATKWFVEGIWPRYSLNLVVGSSGSGKSRWILPQLAALQKGEPVLGRPSCGPVKVAYVLCDRPSQEAFNTMEEIGVDPKVIPTFSFMDIELPWTLDNIIKNIPSDTELVYVEAIACVLQSDDLSGYHQALRLCRKFHLHTKKTGLSFWGSTHPPKMKKGEGFINDRNSGIGSVGVPGSAGTIAVFYEDSETEREIRIKPHSGPALSFKYYFNEHGVLVETSQDIGKAILDFWLKGLPAGKHFTTAEAQDQAERCKLGRASGTRWLTESVNDGRIIKLARGVYQKSHDQ